MSGRIEKWAHSGGECAKHIKPLTSDEILGHDPDKVKKWLETIIVWADGLYRSILHDGDHFIYDPNHSGPPALAMPDSSDKMVVPYDWHLSNYSFLKRILSGAEYARAELGLDLVNVGGSGPAEWRKPEKSYECPECNKQQGERT